MLGFKATSSARAILSGIEVVHMMRKGQVNYACSSQLYLVEQFSILAT
jgi:transposase-like protein